MTRIVPSIRAAEPIRIATQIVVPTAITPVRVAGRAPPPRRSLWRATVLAPVIGALVALAAPPFIGDPEHTLADRARGALDTMRSMFEAAPTERVVAESSVPAAPPPLQSVFAQSPPVDRMPARAEAPDAVAPVAPKVAGEDPVAKPSSPIDEPKVSSPVAQARAKPGAPPTRTQSVLNSSQSASGIARPAHPLSRWASTAIPKPSRAPSIAGAGVSGHSSRRQALAPQQRFLAPPPPVQVAAASAASGAPIASSGTDPPSSAPSNLAAQQRSSQPSAAADQAPAEPTGTVTEDRRKPTAGTIASSTATSQRQRNPQNQQTFSDWRTLLANLGTVLRGRDGPPASVEERSIAAPAPQAAPRLPASTPRASSAPAPSERLRAEASPFATPAPLATPSTLVADARTQVTTSGISAPPVPSSPPMGESVASSRDRSQDVLVAQARRMVADTVPSIAARAQPDVSRVLGLAATANHQSQQQAVVDAARARWSAETAWTPATDIDPIRARRLHDDARQAFTSGRVSDALNIELSAFGANPRDPDIAAYLAFLHMKMNPAQPELARQLALYAIFVSGSRRSARFGDWGTLAIASALAGREIDAARAFLVEVALTSNLDRTCQIALSAYAGFGERLRVPVYAMLDRIDSSDRVSPYCEWPPIRSTATRW